MNYVAVDVMVSVSDQSGGICSLFNLILFFS